jgi:hypothetical protein
MKGPLVGGPETPKGVRGNHLAPKGGDARMPRGAAIEERRHWLEACPAVKNGSITKPEDSKFLEFEFDPEKVPAVVPEGVIFEPKEPAF